MDRCRQAVDLDPDNPFPHRWLGGLLRLQGRLDEAEEEFRCAIQYAGDRDLARAEASATSALGGLRYLRGRQDEALALFERAARVDPTYDWAFWWSARFHGSLGRDSEAAVRMLEAIEIDPRKRYLASRTKVLLAHPRPDEALRIIESAIEEIEVDGLDERAADRAWMRYDRGLFLEKLGRVEEAIRSHSEALELDPEYAVASDKIAQLLHERTRPVSPELAVLLRDRTESRMQDPRVLAIRAALEFLEGDREKAVLALERAMREPHVTPLHKEMLASYREGVRDLVSYASIDWALASWDLDPRKDLELLEENREVWTQTDRRDAGDLLVYLRGRVLERAGKPGQAAAEFGRLAGLDCKSPEPHLRFAACLSAAGDPERARNHLRKVLESGLLDRKGTWDSAMALCDLEIEPAEVLSYFSAKKAGDVDDLEWLLEQLRAGRTIRINCGSEEDLTLRGEMWGRDRFYRSGHRHDRPRCRIEGTESAFIHQTWRWLGQDGERVGYCIPLPKGTYRVTVHLCERKYRAPGLRSFDILLEDRAVFESYEPFTAAGFANADQRTFTCDVADGCLDLELLPRREDPEISAIEIERLE